MATVTVHYLGDLHTECKHEQSGATIQTDAPLDNNGKGEAFSPTDLCVTALASCAVTIMGMYAQNHDCDITGTTISVQKTMSATPPRRIAAIEVTFTMPNKPFTDKQKEGLERAALTCPVHKSLHPDMEQTFRFNWP